MQVQRRKLVEGAHRVALNQRRKLLNFLERGEFFVTGSGSRGRKHRDLALLVKITGSQQLLQYWAGVRIKA